MLALPPLPALPELLYVFPSMCICQCKWARRYLYLYVPMYTCTNSGLCTPTSVNQYTCASHPTHEYECVYVPCGLGMCLCVPVRMGVSVLLYVLVSAHGYVCASVPVSLCITTGRAALLRCCNVEGYLVDTMPFLSFYRRLDKCSWITVKRSSRIKLCTLRSHACPRIQLIARS